MTSCTHARSGKTQVRLMSCVDVYGPRPIAMIDFQMEFGVQVLSYISAFMMWPMPSSHEPRSEGWRSSFPPTWSDIRGSCPGSYLPISPPLVIGRVGVATLQYGDTYTALQSRLNGPKNARGERNSTWRPLGSRLSPNDWSGTEAGLHGRNPVCPLWSVSGVRQDKLAKDRR